ncbi:hypothetical protein D3C87_1988310 [compost metagenome]
MHVCFYFRAFFQEVGRMLQFEIEIVVVRVRAETDLLDNHFLRFRLDFLLLLFLLVFEL